MDDPDLTMEEYIELEAEKLVGMAELVTGKQLHMVRYGFSSEPTVSPKHFDEVNLKDETSLSEYNDEDYNVISFNDLFSNNMYFINDSKMHTDNDDDKIHVKQFSKDTSIEPLPNVISIDIDTMHKG
uniref:Uncharacterized protein n=1 Tax=Tanacetum cinerariifolium TaxID=118510 RepID=A0A699IQ69_TANCI|nr:hypothetical protein [Tanacetum cinerariifolium]